MSIQLFFQGLLLLLKGTWSLFKAVFFLPLPAMPWLLNLMLQELNTFNYTQNDMKEQPWSFSVIGWLFSLIATSMLSPILLFFQPPTMQGDVELFTFFVILGIVAWIIVAIYTLANIQSILKTLTVWFTKAGKKLVRLFPKKLTANDGAIQPTT